MAERKKFDKGLINVGDLITKKRKLWVLVTVHVRTLSRLEAKSYFPQKTGYLYDIWQILKQEKIG